MPVRVDMDRSLGALLGLGVGDALGAPVEGMTAERARELLGGPVTDMTGGNGVRPGQVTDDTEMAICLSRALIASGGFDPGLVMKEYLEWFATGPYGIGHTIAGTLARVRDGASPYEAARMQHEESGGLSAGNGALMRATPIALAFAGNENGLREATVEDAGLTHFDPLAGKAAVLHNEVVSWCITRGPNAPLEELADPTWLDDRLEDVVVEAIAGLRSRAEHRAASEGAYVLAALHVGLTAFFTAESFEEGLLWAVNLGGDADTNASVSGALLGARFGAAAIPSRWLEALERRADLETLHAHLVKLA